METAVVQQFLNFFQDFIDLCQLENWPDNNTSEQEIRNAFLMSQHVEKCLNKLQKKGIIDEFLSVLNSRESSNHVIKSCLLDPPKYILKKVINSNTKINVMDISFKLYLELFSEDNLEACLTDLLLEAASKETLITNLTKEIEKDKVMIFKSKVLLSELNSCNLNISDMVCNCNETTIEVLVLCLLNVDSRYTAAVKVIKQTFLNILHSKDSVYKKFWRLLLNVEENYFIEMCLENLDIYKLIIEALLDYGKLLREDMSTELFYIQLGKSELQSIVRRLCKNESLKVQLFLSVNNYDADVEFWTNMLC